MGYAIAASGRTHAGKVHIDNEDSYFIGERLVVVADGVGGSAAGEIASRTVVEQFAAIETAATTETDTETDEDIYDILTAATRRSSDAIEQQVDADPSLAGMGTTLTAMMCGKRKLVFAQVGDSRAYFRRHSPPGGLHQVTKDDSFVQFLLDSGMIKADEALGHPRRNIILKAVDGTEVTPTFSTFAPIVGDRYLLCSDGLSDYTAPADVEAALENSDLETASAELIDLALQAGAPDNVTVIVVDIVEQTSA